MTIKDNLFRPTYEQPAPVGLTTATARTLFAPLLANGARAALVASRLETAIQLGLLLDGERLPAELQLATQLGVSTVTLREALSILRERGLIVTRRGRGGGTIVRAPADRFEPLRNFSSLDLRDLGDQRAAVAGAAARLAAQRALPVDVRRLEEQARRLQTATTASDQRRADAEFAIAIAGAAQSPRLAREESRLRAQVGDLLELGDRDLLVAAIRDRQDELARELAERRVATETERLIRRRLAMVTPPPRRRSMTAEPAALSELVQELECVLSELDELAAQFGALLDEADGHPRRAQLESLRPGIFELLERHADLATGAGVIAAPEVLIDAPRWLEWWWARKRTKPEALRVNLDPLAPDFYDYTVQDWYARVGQTLQPQLAGPYVDYACTNEYAITLATPVCSAAGTFVGVAAADVLVSSIERRILPALSTLTPAVTMTSTDGRVIVCTDAAVVPGQRLKLQGAVQRMLSPSSACSWLLVEVQPPRSAA